MQSDPIRIWLRTSIIDCDVDSVGCCAQERNINDRCCSNWHAHLPMQGSWPQGQRGSGSLFRCRTATAVLRRALDMHCQSLRDFEARVVKHLCARLHLASWLVHTQLEQRERERERVTTTRTHNKQACIRRCNTTLSGRNGHAADSNLRHDGAESSILVVTMKLASFFLSVCLFTHRLDDTGSVVGGATVVDGKIAGSVHDSTRVSPCLSQKAK